MVRAKLTELIGGLPMYSGPLNPRVTGRLQSDTHTIEKVIFESLPGFYITANLYRPNMPGRYPAVLIPAGHTQEGKPETQTVAANLAAKGYSCVLWTDSTNWMNRLVPLGPPYRYRYVGEGDGPWIEEFLR